MRRKLEDWSKVYSSVGISQLTRFTKTTSNRMDGIVSRATFRISSGKIEGVNGFIKALRRRDEALSATRTSIISHTSSGSRRIRIPYMASHHPEAQHDLIQGRSHTTRSV